MNLSATARPQLVLASASVRRRELLAQIGVRFEVLPVDVSEARHAGERAPDCVQRLALEKAQAGWLRSKRELPVLGADTVVELEGTILGKPADGAQARQMLEALSGREHRVYTGVAISRSGRHARRLSCTRVRFRTLNPAELRAFAASEEPLDKAGAYAIQGRAAIFVADLRGSYSGVVGLPLFETAALLREFGVNLL